MVYESDFYTTRRPYSRPLASSYSVTKRDTFPWEKVPFVPRPSLVPEPFTVWGRKKQDPRKEFYQYATLKEKEGVVRGKNVAKEDHARQLLDGGTVSKVNLDAAAELATKGHVFEKGVLSRQAGPRRHAFAPATGRTRILMALQTPSCTPIVLPLSTIIQLRGAPRMPYVAHKRLVSVIHVPIHNVYYTGSMLPIRIHSRVRPSIIAAELKRIRDLPRPSTGSYTDHFLNSRDHIYFDDEAKEIRARVDSLLRRVHVFVPRASPSDFAEEIVPERMRSGDYVRRLISGRNNAKKDGEMVSWYDVPERGNFGNLACVKYIAGKPQSVRRPYYKVADLRPSDIKNDVNFLSYYQKNRQAAANASPGQPMTERELRKARALETEWSESIAIRESKKLEEEPVEEEEPMAPKPKAAKESKPKKPKEVKIETPKENATPAMDTSKVIEYVAEPVKPAKEKEIAVEPSLKKVETVEEPPKEVPVKVELAKESETLPEPAPVEQKPEPAPVEKKAKPVEKKAKPAEKKAEPVIEQKIEPAVEKMEEPVVEKKEEPVVEQKIEPAAEPTPEVAPEPVVEPPAQPTEEPITTEPASEESIKPVEESAASESVQDAMPEPTEEAETVESNELVSEQDQQQEETEEVRQDKLDAIKRAEEYLRKAEEEARTEEERRAAAEQERLRLEMEEQKAWEALQIDVERKAHLDEILDQEKALAERKAEEERLEAEQAEIERLETAERKLNSEKLKALMEEQERMIVEERAEEVRQRQEREERLAEVARGEVGATKDNDCSREDHLMNEMTDQEMEEKPYEVTTDDDTRIEEENAVEDEVDDIPVDTFAEEPEGAESRPVLASGGGTAIEDVFTSTQEETFEWPKDDDA